MKIAIFKRKKTHPKQMKKSLKWIANLILERKVQFLNLSRSQALYCRPIKVKQQPAKRNLPWLFQILKKSKFIKIRRYSVFPWLQPLQEHPYVVVPFMSFCQEQNSRLVKACHIYLTVILRGRAGYELIYITNEAVGRYDIGLAGYELIITNSAYSLVGYIYQLISGASSKNNCFSKFSSSPITGNCHSHDLS